MTLEVEYHAMAVTSQDSDHYENMPMQNTEIFKVVKNENFHKKNFHKKNFDIFLIFAQNIDCGYTLVARRF